MPPTALPDRVRDRADLDALLAATTNWEERPDAPPARTAFRLHRVQRLLAAVGDPQVGPRTAHVAGSKGKGSVARMLDAVLRTAGGPGPVGLYTSPHLEDLAERVAVDGRPADDEALAAAATRCLPHVRATHGTPDAPTFFEVFTAIAWLVFRAHGCRDVVLETGLGGRLDATNVCRPSVTAITTIEREHVQVLGDDLATIAAEKAGIVKPGVPVVTAVEGVALDVVTAAARAAGAPLLRVGVDARIVGATTGPGARTRATLAFPDGEPLALDLPVAGRHHAGNAAMAALAAQVLGVNRADVARGLGTVVLPGVLEPVATRPLVVVDAAHTPASARAARDTLEACWPARPRVLLLAFLADKDVEAFAAGLLPGADGVVVTVLDGPRAMPAEVAARRLAAAGAPAVEVVADREAALRRARTRAGADGVVLATGSLRLAGWARGHARTT